MAVVLITVGVSANVFGQTRGPSPLRESLPTIEEVHQIDALYTDRAPFVIGWNWNGPMHGVNKGLHSNTFHIDYPFIWSTPAEQQRPQHILETMPDSSHLILTPSVSTPVELYSVPTLESFLPWYSQALDEDVFTPGGWRVHRNKERIELNIGHGNGPAYTEAMGMRFHPEISVEDTASFSPRERSSQLAVWGFRVRENAIGFVPDDPDDENYQRVVLDKSRVSRMTTVLDQSWPQQQFSHWKSRSDREQTRSFNGQKMYVGVNLRRAEVTDTVMDREPLLELLLHYTLADGSQHLMRFDSLPSTTKNNVLLPLTYDGQSRGLVRPLEKRTSSSPVTSFIVTRDMVPRGDEPERDVTIQAHFNAVDGSQHHTDPLDQNALLRDRWRLRYDANDADAGRIIRMWIEVRYAGKSNLAIDWVQVGSENYTWLTQGYHDTIIRDGYRTMIRELTLNNELRDDGSEPTRGDNIRIWKWFNRDEAPPSYWNALGYTNTLFDDRTTTELDLVGEGVGLVKRYAHTSGTRTFWEGTTPRFTNNAPAPYYRRGYAGNPDSLQKYYWVRWGVDNTLSRSGDTLDYDLFWGGDRVVDSSGSQYTTALPAEFGEELTPYGQYPKGLQNGQSIQTQFERSLWNLKEMPEYLFSDSTDWLPNIWVVSHYTQRVHGEENADTMIVSTGSSTRHLTGEEASLMSWVHVILGAKGLIYYYGANRDSIVESSWYNNGRTNSVGIGYGPANDRIDTYYWDGLKWVDTLVLRFPELSREDNKTLAGERTNLLHTYGSRDKEIGDDWLAPSNSTGLWQAMDANRPPLHAGLGNLYGSRATGRYYLGWLSVRSAIKSVADDVTSMEEVLQRLHLRAWHSKGYRSWTVGDSDALSSRVNTDGIRTRHPWRDVFTVGKSWERRDSTFVELTLHQDGSTSMDRSFVLGVLNRRCNPYDYDPRVTETDTNHVDYSVYRTYEEHRQRYTRDASFEFAQSGSREIAIPFTYHHPDGLPRTFRVQRLGFDDLEDDGHSLLDTIVEQDGIVHLRLQPGEGAMLAVTVLPDIPPSLFAPGSDNVLQVYPNPASDNATVIVRLPDVSTPVELSVYSLEGRVMKSFTTDARNVLQLDLQEMSAGTYSIVVSDVDRTYATAPLVILR